MYGRDDCEYDYYDTGMGFAPIAIAAAAQPVVSVVSSIVNPVSKILKGLLGGTPKQRQAKRVKAYAELYKLAVQGNESALQELRIQSLGSATADSKKAASAQYEKAVDVLESAGYTITAPPAGTKGYIRLTAPATAGASPGAYSFPVAQASVLGNLGTPILLGGAALALFMLTKSKRR